MNEEKLKRIEYIVSCLKKFYHNSDPFYIARKLGVKCNMCELTDGAPAFSMQETEDDPGTIFIDSKLSLYSKKILCAHELGHLFFHSDYLELLFDPEINPIYEYEANYFAAMLLPQILSNSNIEEFSIHEFNEYIAEKVKY